MKHTQRLSNEIITSNKPNNKNSLYGNSIRDIDEKLHKVKTAPTRNSVTQLSNIKDLVTKCKTNIRVQAKAAIC